MSLLFTSSPLDLLALARPPSSLRSLLRRLSSAARSRAATGRSARGAPAHVPARPGKSGSRCGSRSSSPRSKARWQDRQRGTQQAGSSQPPRLRGTRCAGSTPDRPADQAAPAGDLGALLCRGRRERRPAERGAPGESLAAPGRTRPPQALACAAAVSYAARSKLLSGVPTRRTGSTDATTGTSWASLAASSR